jgi:hypothetical protein
MTFNSPRSLPNSEAAASPAKIAADPKRHRLMSPKPRVGANSPEVGPAEDDTAKTQCDHFFSPLANQHPRSQLDSISMKPNIDLCNSEPQLDRKVSVKPTPKLMQAFQNLGPESKPLHVKLVRRESERDEDTSEYESNSGGDTLSDESPLRSIPKTKGRDHPATSVTTVNAAGNFDLSSLLQKANIDLSQIAKQKVEETVDFSGIPVWFPLKIKRILKDDGFPDALPFKVRNHGWALSSINTC